MLCSKALFVYADVALGSIMRGKTPFIGHIKRTYKKAPL